MADPTIVTQRKQTDPELMDLLNLLRKQINLDINCHAIATIQSFDSAKQTVSASLNYKKTTLQRKSDGTYENVLIDYPLLLDVPAIFLGGGLFRLTFPIAKGDTCLILFNDRDIDNWLQSGQVGPVASSRMHSFSDGIALVGLRPTSSPLEDFDTSRAALGNGDTYVAVGPTKIKVANPDTTLNTLLQNLLTQLQSLTTQLALLTVSGVTPGPGVSGVPVNAAAITAIGTNIGTIATQIGGLLE